MIFTFPNTPIYYGCVSRKGKLIKNPFSKIALNFKIRVFVIQSYHLYPNCQDPLLFPKDLSTYNFLKIYCLPNL